MSFRTLLDEIKKHLPSPNYILVSSDPFLHTEAVRSIRELVPAEERDFNFHAFDLMNTGNGSISLDQILDILNTMPFFAGRKFVIIANFQKILKKDFERLETYLLNPSASSVLILLNSGPVKKNLRDRLKSAKQILLDIREKDIPLWLKSRARSRGFLLSDSAADYLVGTIGPDLGMLSSELDKCTLIGKDTVDRIDIIEIVEGKRTYSAFDLVDAIRTKDTEKAFKIYSVLRETEEPYSLLGALNWQYGRFIAAKKTPEEKQYDYKAFDILKDADIQIKSSGSFYPIELLLIKLLRLSRKTKKP